MDTPKILDLIHPEDKNRIANEIKKGREEKILISKYDFRVRKKNGEYIWLEDLLKREFNTQGEVVRIIVNSREITSRKKMEESLQIALEKYSTLVNSTDAAVWEADGENILINYISPTIEKMLGYPAQDWYKPDFWANHIHPEDKERALNTAIENISNYTGYSQQYRFIASDGRVVWLRSSVSFNLKDGIIYRRYGVITDITELKKKELDPKESEIFLSQVIENLPIMVFVKDATSLRFIKFNKEGENLLGFSREELLGKNDYDFFPKEEANFFTSKDREVLKGESIYEIPEEEIQTRNKGIRILNTKKIPIFDESGKAKYLLGISNDITEKKKSEEELRKAKEEAEEENKAKSFFLASMSHEIRTPMNAIIGSIQILNQSSREPELEKYFQIIKSAGNTLVTIISDILDFSKIETETFEINKESASLTVIMKDVENILFPDALEKRLTLKFNYPENLYPFKTDPLRLKQVLINLGSNAIKFTDSGNIIFSVTIEEETDSEIGLHFSVSDTGIGIPSDKLEKIFIPFKQVLDYKKAKTHGAGLGLAISKNIIDRLGGKIKVESNPGQGSIFSFSLKFEKSDFSKITEIQTIKHNFPKSFKILIAEDDPLNQLIIGSLLKEFNLHFAENGKEAIEILSKENFDLVLMDIHMPVMDGFETTKLIRDKNSSVLNHEIPIIAVTAYALHEAKQESTKVAMNGFITKPVNYDGLLSEIQRVIAS